MVSERSIEEYLVKRVKMLGGTAYKFTSSGHDGMPDRMICLPGGLVFFVELKAPGQKSTVIQGKQQRDLRALGCRVYADVDSKYQVDQIITINTQGYRKPLEYMDVGSGALS